MRPAAVRPEDLHPHVSLLHRLTRGLLFTGGTPIVVWLLVSFLIPAACGLGHHADAWVGYLERVRRVETWQAERCAPALTWRGTVLVPAAWPLRCATGLVARLLPTGDAAPAVPAATPTPAPHALIATLQARADRYLADRFLPIQRAWLVTSLVRALFACQLTCCALPACAAAYCLGAGAARARLRAGRMPMAHRFQWLLWGLTHSLACLPVLIVLPVPLPTVPLVAAVWGLVVVLILHARRHFIEV